MLTRRALLVGTAAIPIAGAPFPVFEQARALETFKIVLKCVEKSIDFCMECNQGHPFDPFLPDTINVWMSKSNLAQAVYEELRNFYPELVATLQKTGDPLWVDYGNEKHFSLAAQLFITDRFPWVPSEWPKAAFDALASFAPAHLR